MMRKALPILFFLAILIIPVGNINTTITIQENSRYKEKSVVLEGDIIVESGEIEHLSNLDVILAGKIVVYSKGTLIIENSIIKFDLDYDGQYYIRVEKGGSLEIINSTITSNDPRYKYYIIVLENSTVRIEDSTFSNMGYSDDYPGLTIFADNALIKDSTFLVNYVGVVIKDSHNVTILNSTFTENWDGIRIDKASNITIENSYFYGGQVGIRATSSTNLTIKGSRFGNVASYGAVITGSADVRILDNYAENCGFGFYISDSKDVNISRNTILDSSEQGLYLLRVTNLNISENNIASSGKYGLYMEEVINTIVEKNNLTEDMIWINGDNDTYETIIIKEDNLVNSFPVLYLFGNSSIEFLHIKHYGQIILIYSTNITFNRTFVDSLLISDSSDILIYRVTSSGNIDSGILVYNSEIIRIIGYRISDADTGIGVEYSNDVFITDCDIQNGGIYLFRSNKISVSSCYFAYNEYGIFASFVDNLNISLNTFYRNYCGVGLGTGVTNALIYMNNFLYNSKQAYDEGSAIWDNGIIGNFWSDYAGPDRNFDSIGDRPYQIDSNSFDRYPSFIPLPKYSYDTKPPNVERIYLSTERPQANQKFEVFVEASDDVGIANVILYVTYDNTTEYYRMLPDGERFKTEIGPYPYNTNLTLKAVVYDLAGNSEESSNITFAILDTIPPTIINLSWSPEKPNTTDVIEISAVIEEEQTKIKAVYLYYTINNGITWIKIPMGTTDGRRYIARIGPFNKPVSLLFYIEATDEAGNSISSQIITIIIGEPIKLISAYKENLIILSSLAVLGISIIVTLYSFRRVILKRLKKIRIKRKRKKKS